MRASFIPANTLSIHSSRRRRRQTQIQHILLVVIRFIIAFSTCDYACQQNTLIPIITNINSPPHAIIVVDITLNLQKPIISK